MSNERLPQAYAGEKWRVQVQFASERARHFTTGEPMKVDAFSIARLRMPAGAVAPAAATEAKQA